LYLSFLSDYAGALAEAISKNKIKIKMGNAAIIVESRNFMGEWSEQMLPQN